MEFFSIYLFVVLSASDLKNIVVVPNETAVCGAFSESYDHSFRVVNCNIVFHLGVELISLCGIV